MRETQIELGGTRPIDIRIDTLLRYRPEYQQRFDRVPAAATANNVYQYECRY